MSLLSPELSARVERIAAAQKKSVPEVIEDAVTAHWVGFATRSKLAQRDW